MIGPFGVRWTVLRAGEAYPEIAVGAAELAADARQMEFHCREEELRRREEELRQLRLEIDHQAAELAHAQHVWNQERQQEDGRLADAQQGLANQSAAERQQMQQEFGQAFAEREGMPAADALRLAKQCVLGSASLAQDSADSPAQLRKNVTSKGGTTEAALRVFEEEQLAERFAKALAAATKRGGELGDVLGKD